MLLDDLAIGAPYTDLRFQSAKIDSNMVHGWSLSLRFRARFPEAHFVDLVDWGQPLLPAAPITSGICKTRSVAQGRRSRWAPRRYPWTTRASCDHPRSGAAEQRSTEGEPPHHIFV